MRPVVVVLARAPSAKGKTRLTPNLSDARGAELRAALLLDTIDVATATGIRTLVCFDPPDARVEITALVPDATAFPQRGADLGQRMRHAVDDALGMGADAVALIGSDLPTLPPERIVDAFAMLAGADVVLGPSDDGGFYLVASRRPLTIVDDVEWSTPRVLGDVVANAHASGLMVGVLPPWSDVDVPEDLRQVLADPRPDVAPRVRAWAQRG